MPNRRKKNPFLLDSEEKTQVVSLFARFKRTSEVIDTVLSWKPDASTGDTSLDRKYVADAIRTCNPHAAQFSYETTLLAKRSEYLSETSGSYVALLRTMQDKMLEALPQITFDTENVPITAIGAIVGALSQLETLLENLGMSPSVSEALKFSEGLDKFPLAAETPYHSFSFLLQTRRMLFNHVGALENALSEVHEKGVKRDVLDVLDDSYPTVDTIPDCVVSDVWQKLTDNYDTPLPSRKQMLLDIDKETDEDGVLLSDPDMYWWEWSESLESRLSRIRGLLDANTLGISAKDTAEIREYLLLYENDAVLHRYICNIARSHQIKNARELEKLIKKEAKKNTYLGDKLREYHRTQRDAAQEVIDALYEKYAADDEEIAAEPEIS